MNELISLFLLVIAQNASFTLVSRARNSGSLIYHLLAAIGSNGIWLLVFREMVTKITDTPSMLTYLIASVAGSLLMHYVAMKYFEKPKKKKWYDTLSPEDTTHLQNIIHQEKTRLAAKYK